MVIPGSCLWSVFGDCLGLNELAGSQSSTHSLGPLTPIYRSLMCLPVHKSKSVQCFKPPGVGRGWAGGGISSTRAFHK